MDIKNFKQAQVIQKDIEEYKHIANSINNAVLTSGKIRFDLRQEYSEETYGTPFIEGLKLKEIRDFALNQIKELENEFEQL